MCAKSHQRYMVNLFLQIILLKSDGYSSIFCSFALDSGCPKRTTFEKFLFGKLSKTENFEDDFWETVTKRIEI